jgi:hypothetical protein
MYMISKIYREHYYTRYDTILKKYRDNIEITIIGPTLKYICVTVGAHLMFTGPHEQRGRLLLFFFLCK